MENGKDIVWSILPSTIHGDGVFSRKWFSLGEHVGVGITFAFGFYPVVTYFGSKINHSYDPNVFLIFNIKTTTYDLIAIKSIGPGTEILMDYRNTPPYISKPETHYK